MWLKNIYLLNLCSSKADGLSIVLNVKTVKLAYQKKIIYKWSLDFEVSDTIEKNKVVSFTYSILNDKGKVEEQSDVPMEYVHGADDRVFPLVVEAMEGAKVGDTKEIILGPLDGFGVYDENKTYRDKVENVPPGYRVVGAEATFKNEDDQELKMKVVSVENGEVLLDGNHPFAGRTMTFKITVEAVRQATAEEIETGLVIEQQLDDQSKPVVH